MTQIDIDTGLVEALIEEQFPQWSGLLVRPVARSGWDNRTFHLGDGMSVRLPSADHYNPQVEKEQEWLPKLAPALPLPIPEPLAVGRPGPLFPRPWSVYRWLPGEVLENTTSGPDRLALDLAVFLRALHAIPPDGPSAGPHNFQRGAALSVYDEESRQALEALRSEVDTAAIQVLWDRAVATRWQKPSVWIHGDVAPGNLLVVDGRLGAVIDFGCMGVGDPACDLVMAWTWFQPAERKEFRDALPLDDDTWLRGAGWALWKALITLERQPANEELCSGAHRTIEAVLSDPRL